MIKSIVQRIVFVCLSTYLLFAAIIVAMTSKEFGTFEWIVAMLFVAPPLILDIKLFKSLKKSFPNRRVERSATSQTVEVGPEAQIDFFSEDVTHEYFEGINNEFERLNNENDIRILKDSIYIMQNTENIDTFFVRHNTVLSVLERMEVSKKQEALFSFQQFEEWRIPILLETAYRNTRESTEKLKTQKAKENRYVKLLEVMLSHKNKIPVSVYPIYEKYVNALKNSIHREVLDIQIDERSIRKLKGNRDIMNEVDHLFLTMQLDSSNETLRNVNEEEKVFIATLVQSMRQMKIPKRLTLHRLSDKTLNVMLIDRSYVGKINVGNRENHMQILRDEEKVDLLRGVSFEECLLKIPLWIKFIQKYLMEY